MKGIRLFVPALGLLLFSCAHPAEQKEEEIEFSVIKPLQTDTTIYKDYVAQVRSANHIELRSQEKGYLEKIFVDEGQFVKKGQLMFKLMPVIYQAEVDKAKAELEAAEIEYNNAKGLADKNIISPSELALAKAKMSQAKASFSLAQAHLNFTEIKAPFGISAGNLPLNPEPGLCTTGSSLPLPVLITYGTSDPAMPAAGGCVANLGGACNRGRVVSQTATINYWLQRNGLTGVTPQSTTFDINTNDAGNVEKRVYAGANPLVHYVLYNAGHTVPSRSVFSATTPATGAQNRDIEFAVEVWQFFRGFL